MKIIVVGAGIAGLSAAIALSIWMKDKPEITVLELRPEPSSIGGAIGLTPNALRSLHHLGVLDVIREKKLGAEIDRIELFNAYSGGRLGSIDFEVKGGEYKGLRVMRKDLMAGLFEVVNGLGPGVRVRYGCKITKIEEEDEAVGVTLEGGEVLRADLLVGGDGIHSVVRRLLVEPERKPEYTGIAALFGFTDLAEGSELDLPWKDTAMCQSRYGSLLCSFWEPTRRKIFVAAVMETEDVKSREGWLAAGSEQEVIRRRVEERYAGRNAMGCLNEIIGRSEKWTLYPVFMLGPEGKWCTRRCMLLGDAAHAMPPQGESGAFAMEDAIIFARVMSDATTTSLTDSFASYERIRRPRANEAYRQATFGWGTQKDSGWLMFQLRTWLTTLFLWWTKASREKRYGEDLAGMKLSP